MESKTLPLIDTKQVIEESFMLYLERNYPNFETINDWLIQNELVGIKFRKSLKSGTQLDQALTFGFLVGLLFSDFNNEQHLLHKSLSN